MFKNIFYFYLQFYVRFSRIFGISITTNVGLQVGLVRTHYDELKSRLPDEVTIATVGFSKSGFTVQAYCRCLSLYERCKYQKMCFILKAFQIDYFCVLRDCQNGNIKRKRLKGNIMTILILFYLQHSNVRLHSCEWGSF